MFGRFGQFQVWQSKNTCIEYTYLLPCLLKIGYKKIRFENFNMLAEEYEFFMFSKADGNRIMGTQNYDRIFKNFL